MGGLPLPGVRDRRIMPHPFPRIPMRIRLPFLLAAVACSPLAGQDAPRRLTVSDLHQFRDVSDPQLSPDGGWVAYTVSRTRLKDDDRSSDLWMTSWDGRTTLRLTTTAGESEHSPRWSPDGRSLAFLSGRGDEEGADQLWLLPRAGGEAERVTEIKAGISDYAWSPMGDRLVLVIEDGDSVETSRLFPDTVIPPQEAPAPADTASPKTRPPLVIDRYYFKEDYSGYVRRKRSHLYLYTLADRRLEQLTFGAYDELAPAWSPDGRYLAFASKRGPDPDRTNNYDVWIIQADRGAVPRQLTTHTGPDGDPDRDQPIAWSPDGHRVAYIQGGPDSLIYYAGPNLAVLPWGGSAEPAVLTAKLDRHVNRPTWAADGTSLYFLLEDDRSIYLARMPAAGGTIERLAGQGATVYDYSLGKDGRIALLVDQPARPAEVYALEGGALRPLSHQNDSLLATLRVAPVEDISVKSPDGTVVNGFLIRPIGYEQGIRYPTILTIHGGPVGQYQREFDFYWQLLAAEGYAVVAMNPRGSSGRGEKFSLAIWADWGNKDAKDVLAGVDHAVRVGVADPDRLGVGGWSYGGILTDQVISQDQRFKAATSGAGMGNAFAGFGTDMYIREWTAEVGTPWKNTATYLKLSAPFLHADRIRTPTLFLCGERDFNVPLLNSEQMYQALRSLGVPTKLIIYPGQFHGISKPSYQQHRYEAYLAWYAEHITRP